MQYYSNVCAINKMAAIFTENENENTSTKMSKIKVIPFLPDVEIKLIW